MTGVARGILGTAIGAGVALGLAGLSQIRYVPDTRPEALVRISWRARAERIEHCRTLTAAEQENLPAHMRQQRICEGRNAVYRLRAAIDDVPVVQQIARGSGTRQRRPILVFREVRLAPGRHHLRVEFEREPAAGAGRKDTEEENDEDEEERESALPARLELEATGSFAPRQVVLITYDPDRRALVEVRAERSPSEE